MGSHLVERLLDEGYTVRCILREGSDHRWLESLDIERIYGSYADTEIIKEAAKGVNVTFHLAAATKARSIEDFRRINVEGTRKLAGAVAYVAAGSRFVFASSQAAAGPSTPGNPKTEEATPIPISDYGQSKLEAERIFTETNPGVSWIIIRPGAVYGPRDKDILPFFRIVNKGFIPRVGLKKKYLNLIYISDLVEILTIAARRTDLNEQVYFAAHPEVTEYGGFGAAIAQALGKKKYFKLTVPVPLLYTVALINELQSSIAGKVPALNRDKAREMSQSHWTCDTSIAREHLGFEAKIGIDEGMKSTVSWYIENGWL